MGNLPAKRKIVQRSHAWAAPAQRARRPAIPISPLACEIMPATQSDPEAETITEEYERYK